MDGFLKLCKMDRKGQNMLLRNEYKEDLKERIRETPDDVFEAEGLSKEQILADEEIIDRLWTVYQKDMEEYECEEWWAYQDSLNEVLGIDFDAGNLLADTH